MTSPPFVEPASRALVPFPASFPPIPLPLPPPHNKAVMVNGGCAVAAEGEFDADDDKKREREHKKRSKNWTRSETLALIRLRTDLAPRFAKTGRKSELWDEISDALQKERYCRDAQQCRDKWEKLMAGYKEVRDGLKERDDNPYYDELQRLLAGRPSRRETERQASGMEASEAGDGRALNSRLGSSMDVATKLVDKEGAFAAPSTGGNANAAESETPEERVHVRKKSRGPKFVASTDLQAVQTLLETIVSKQQKFFSELLDAMERKEQHREQLRQEREERWRADERAQRGVLTEAMLILTQKLGTPQPVLGAPLVCSPVVHQAQKRRSKNWKRAEVLQLIKLRGEMESRFKKSTRRAALWEELAETLGAEGIKRDAKQCREKWDKLMSEYKDVLDGKKEQGESPYFAELTASMGGRPGEAG